MSKSDESALSSKARSPDQIHSTPVATINSKAHIVDVEVECRGTALGGT